MAAQIAWLRMLVSSGFPALTRPSGVAVATGLESNTENGAILSLRSAPGEQADALTGAGALVAWLTAQGAPASVLLTEPVPAQQVAGLTALGLTPENSGRDMGAPLGQLSIPRHEVPGVVVDEVTSEQGIAAVMEVLRAAEWFTGDEVPSRIEAARRIGYGPGASVRHWLARAGDRDAGTATSFVFGTGRERTVDLVHCAVLPPFRRRGIGSALTRARIEAGRAAGAQQAVLAPSPDGYQLHRGFGFILAPSLPDRWFYLA